MADKYYVQGGMAVHFRPGENGFTIQTPLARRAFPEPLFLAPAQSDAKVIPPQTDAQRAALEAMAVDRQPVAAKAIGQDPLAQLRMLLASRQ